MQLNDCLKFVIKIFENNNLLQQKKVDILFRTHFIQKKYIYNFICYYKF